MALAVVVDTLESVPEAVRGAYVEREGKFHLDFEVPDVAGLKAALASERGMNKAAKDKVAAWERLGVSPEEIETRLEAERVKAEDALKKAGKFDEVLATHLGNAKKERDTAVEAATKQRDSALGVARHAVIETRIGGALAKAKATPEGLDLLSERLGKRVKLEFDENGKSTESILDADGSPMVGSGPNGLATYDDLVKEAVKQFSGLFEGTGAGGGGTPPKQPGSAGDKNVPRAEWDKMSPYDQSAKIRAGFKPID